MDILTLVYIINFILLLIASYTDIKTREIPHTIVIFMLFINLLAGYYLFGLDAIISFFATLILCLILGIGMGGGDVKIFTALAPIFAYGDKIFYIPKPILLLIGISAGLVALYPLINILRKYWRGIIPSVLGLCVFYSTLSYLFYRYKIPYASLILWIYVIISIFISRKIPWYRELINKLSYLAPVYLLAIYLLDRDYFIRNNLLLSFVVYVLELTLISLVIYALTGTEVSVKKPISQLKEGDILRDIVYIKDRVGKVENAGLWKRFKIMLELEMGKKGDYDKIIMTDGDGLREEDLKLLQNLHKEGKMPVDELTLITTYPFVPFVLIGYVIVLILHYYFKVI
ncbi:MAG TPA: hypothetical protein EYH15_00560 [Methanothermococcus okinawensis]|uniref:Peptidase A24A domain protein n=1 Tax=Methanothermococcus okinawensis TaxID=155863 RepID=A0A832ZB95_9EURY|nr:hypothetical protein [Methanococcaceae archaeon]HIP83978.1 hypothetical protein [Methanothermococcus okinawensis]HIP91563.1 hypothetical protein [Methanothermococcus okinawensis]